MTYKQFALKIAKQAGKIMRQNFKAGMAKKFKADGTPVTVTDIAVNKMVITEVKKYFPGHDVLGEEESHRPNHGKYLWVCDPVDGTLPFSHAIPTFVFALALVKDGEPIVGVIYDPIMDRMLFAEKGKGAFLNNKKIQVSGHKLAGGAVDWDHWTLPRPVVLANKTPFYFGINSVLYGSLLVACGEFVGAVYGADKPHDIAAAKIIVEEAGGKVTDRNGKQQRYDRNINWAIVSNGTVHQGLVNLVKKLSK